MLPRRDRFPRPQLRGRRRGKRTVEPRSGRRREPIHGLSLHPPTDRLGHPVRAGADSGPGSTRRSA
ncbi:hypothetical protein NSERUTF1_1269 [Nocardia seriolae]|nr:hypothetical protein NSERUTF1_1269 [Nocardia seriolae]